MYVMQVQPLEIDNKDQSTISIMHCARLREEGFSGLCFLDAGDLYEIHGESSSVIAQAWIRAIMNKGL